MLILYQDQLSNSSDYCTKAVPTINFPNGGEARTVFLVAKKCEPGPKYRPKVSILVCEDMKIVI